MKPKIAVIGLGCAGFHGIAALRENGWTGEIHVYLDTAHSAANPMLTTYYVGGKIPRERMFPFGTLEQIENAFDVTLHTQSRVARVSAANRTVVTEDGTTASYDKILIATGARAVSPNLGQGGAGRSFMMRTVADADALKEMLDGGSVRSALVVGASMVGIKVVELLAARGISVTLADMASRLFPVACMEEIAGILEADLRERGIRLMLKSGIARVEESADGVKTFLTDGQCLETDILVLCIGTRPNIDLVANTDVVEGEPVPVNKGIIVNERMETGAAGIWAAGDCCEALNVQTGKPMIIGLWANAAVQGRIAGSNMAGADMCYEGSIPSNITHYFDETFIGIGDPNMQGEHLVFANRDGRIAVIRDEGQLRCVNILGNYRISGMIKSLLLHQITGRGDPMTVADAGLLRASGVPEAFVRLLKDDADETGASGQEQLMEEGK